MGFVKVVTGSMSFELTRNTDCDSNTQKGASTKPKAFKFLTRRESSKCRWLSFLVRMKKLERFIPGWLEN